MKSKTNELGNITQIGVCGLHEAGIQKNKLSYNGARHHAGGIRHKVYVKYQKNINVYLIYKIHRIRNEKYSHTCFRNPKSHSVAYLPLVEGDSEYALKGDPPTKFLAEMVSKFTVKLASRLVQFRSKVKQELRRWQYSATDDVAACFRKLEV